MANVCRECEYWKPIENEVDMGDCFGHRVPGSLNISYCPAHSFKARCK